MKNRVLAVALIGALAFGLAGCGGKSGAAAPAAPVKQADSKTPAAQGNNVQESSAESAQANNTVSGTENASYSIMAELMQPAQEDDIVLVYERAFEGENGLDMGEMDAFEKQVVTLTVHKDGTAHFEEATIYKENHATVAVYDGTAKYEDLTYYFNYDAGNNSEYNFGYAFEVEEGEVLDAYYVRPDNEDIRGIVGQFDSYDGRYGDMTLVIKGSGETHLTCAYGGEFEGNTFLFDGTEYNFMGTDMETGESVDWFIYPDLKDHTFTYVDYAVAMYSDYEGIYSATGDLGKLVFTVQPDGKASTWIADEFGNEIELTGNINVDSEARVLRGVYLNDENYLYSLELNFDVVDDQLVYTGRFTKPLAAG